MKNLPLYMCSASIVVLSWGASAAHAQTAAGAAPTTTIEEVIVTARRVQESQQSVPVAVTTLNAAALERKNVKSVNDIQFSVPNLQIKPSNTYPTQPEFIIRGQRQQLYTDENVVTYVNGVPQSTRGLTLYDLESVQALKGPQGTLFGKNSMGGAMLFTTHRPDFKYGGEVDFTLGNYNLKEFTGIANLPLVQDKVALRLAGQVQRRDGVFKNSYPNGKDLQDRKNESGRATLLVKPNDRFESITTADILHRDEIPPPSIIEAAPLSAPGFGGLVALLTQQAVTQQSALGGAVPLVNTGAGILQRQGNPFNVQMPTGIQTTIPAGAINPVSTFGDSVRDYGVANTTTFDVNSDLKVRNILGFRYDKTIEEQEPGGTSGFLLNISPFLTALGGRGLPAFFPGHLVNNNTNYLTRTKTFTEEFQLIGNVPHFKYIAGGFYSHSDLNYQVNSYFTVGPVSLYPLQTRHGFDHVTTDSKALFAQGTYDFGAWGLDKLSVTFGLRYSWDTKEADASNFYSTANDLVQTWPITPGICNELNGTSNGITSVNNAAQCSLNGKRSWSALTWTGSIDYQLNPKTLIYFTSRRGYKAGGANPTTVNQQFAFFDPEYITDFELGLKHDGYIGDIPYRFNIAGFYGKYKQIQTQDILSFCATDACTATYTDLEIFNVGRASIKGVEAEITVKPVHQMTLNLGYSYQTGKYGDGSVIPQPTHFGPIGPNNPIDFENGVNLAGLEFPGVPRQTLNVDASYELTAIPEDFAQAVFSLNYAYRTHTRGLTALGLYPTPAFGVLGGRIDLNNLLRSKISFSIWAQNLTDNAYRLSCADNLNSIGYAACKWGEPRTFGATLSAKF